jgi:hypothetical protein
MISGRTTLIAHLGHPTESFKAPMIYNPWFERRGIDAVVVPMGVMADDYPAFLRGLFRLSNIRGALVTMPHKVTTVALLDAASVAVKVAGSCNAILRREDGSLHGDMFDGEGFTRGAKRKGFDFAGAKCLVVGAGGVGSPIGQACWRYSTPVAKSPKVWPDGCDGIVPASRLSSAATIRRAMTSLSTRRRLAWRRAIHCRSIRRDSIAEPLSARWS